MHLFPETRILRREFKRFQDERNITLWELNPGTDQTACFIISCQPLSQSDVNKEGQPWNLPNSRIMSGRTENKTLSSITAYHCVGIEPRDWPCIWLHGRLLTTQSQWSWKTRSSFELSGNLLSPLSPVLTDWSCGTLLSEDAEFPDIWQIPTGCWFYFWMQPMTCKGPSAARLALSSRRLLIPEARLSNTISPEAGKLTRPLLVNVAELWDVGSRIFLNATCDMQRSFSSSVGFII